MDSSDEAETLGREKPGPPGAASVGPKHMRSTSIVVRVVQALPFPVWRQVTYVYLEVAD